MTTHAELVIARLELGREDFLQGLKGLRLALRGRRPGEAIVWLEDGQMHVRLGGCEVEIPAKGRWPGEARVPGAIFSALLKVPPTGDPIPVWVESGRFFVAGSSMPCHWQKTGAATVEIPLDAGFMDVLRLAQSHSRESLERSGVLSRVAAAQEQVNRIIARAASELAPLGVSVADLEDLVWSRIKASLSRRSGDDPL